MIELKSRFSLSMLKLAVAIAALCFGSGATAFGQTASPDARPAGGSQGEAKAPQLTDDPLFDGIYRKFYDTYRLGPADELSIRIKGQPDYSYEKVKISPAGTIFHMLLGEISVGGLTITQVTERLTNDLSEYFKNPQVSVQLIEAVSAKIAVLGEVIKPDVYVMARPMNVLDAISTAGGFADTGSKSSVEVNRQMSDGSRKILKVNVKNILDGKAKPGDNIPLQAGDLVYVHGNASKTIAKITSLAGFGNFLSFMTLGRK
jgi:polysaccharide export outer membrane protein